MPVSTPARRTKPRRRPVPIISDTTTFHPAKPVLTAEGRRALEKKAAHLREVVLPELLEAVNDPTCEGDIDLSYARGVSELRNLDKLLGEAGTLPERKTRPDVVELGDLVAVEFPDTTPGAVEEFLIVHPVEAAIDDRRISAASPLARAVLGCSVGERRLVAAPIGTYAVRVVATGREATTKRRVA